MQLLPVLFIWAFALLVSPAYSEEKSAVTVPVPEVLPAVKPTAIITLEDVDGSQNSENQPSQDQDTKIDDEIRKKCEQTDYKSYIKCLLKETKRKKRQCASGFCGNSQQCYGPSCLSVIQAQPCPGNVGCLQTNQLQPCVGNGCLQVSGPSQQCVGNGCLQNGQQQQQCSGVGCVFSGYNCYGSGCIQIGQTCYGIGCVSPTIPQLPGPAPCNVGTGSSPCNFQQPQQRPTDQNPTPSELPDLLDEIADIRQQLEQVKRQNTRLIEITEKATTLILNNTNQKPIQPERPNLPISHNLTTSIDISNYINNTNVINLPKVSEKVEQAKPDSSPQNLIPERLEKPRKDSTKTQCCVVVRPKTCRRTWQPPYFVCGHRKHRTCGSPCSGYKVVHSQVKSNCTRNSSESCVSYHPPPYSPQYPAYPVPAYYPQPQMMYYPQTGYPYYPQYAPPPAPPAPSYQTAPFQGYPVQGYQNPPLPIPFYAQPPMYPAPPPSYYPMNDEVIDDCDGCHDQVIDEECDETTLECKKDAKTNPEPGRGDTPDSEDDLEDDEVGYEDSNTKWPRSVPLAELEEVQKEAQEIKKTEEQLTASIDMLQEAVELKNLEKAEEKNEKNVTENNAEDPTTELSQLT